MNLSKYIDIKLNEYRDASDNRVLSLVDDNFVFAYGPFMCMCPGHYERECDEIARYNVTMRIMLHGAYLIRKITGGLSYADVKTTIKNFIISIDNSFAKYGNSEYITERVALTKFATEYLQKIRSEQQAKGDLESFMTCASPVVPYAELIEKPIICQSKEIACTVSAKLEALKENIREELSSLLLNNLAEILINHQMCNVLLDEKTGEIDLTKLDKLAFRNNEVSQPTQLYYFLATMNYYGLQNTPTFTKYLQFLNDMGDFSTTKSFSAFESMINSMAEATNINISTESWEDPSMDEKEEQAITELIKSTAGYIGEEKEVKYDFGLLNDFINVKRYMKFEEFPNRLFLGSLERSNVINITTMGPSRNYYELNTNKVVCPFIDLRDYSPKAVVLHANSNAIEIITDYSDL